MKRICAFFPKVIVITRSFFWGVMEVFMHPCATKGVLKHQKEKWRSEAIRRGATHVVVRFDSFEMESIPLYVMPNDDVDAVCERIRSAGAHSVGEVFSVA